MRIDTRLRGVERLEDRNLLTLVIGTERNAPFPGSQGESFLHEIEQSRAIALSPAQSAAATADGYFDMPHDEQLAYAREQGLALLELIIAEMSKPADDQDPQLEQWIDDAWAWGNEEERLIGLVPVERAPSTDSQPPASDPHGYSSIRLSEAQLQTAYDDGYLEMTLDDQIAYTGRRGLDLVELVIGEMSKPKESQDAAQIDAWIEEGFGWGNLQIELITAAGAAFDQVLLTPPVAQQSPAAEVNPEAAPAELVEGSPPAAPAHRAEFRAADTGLLALAAPLPAAALVFDSDFSTSDFAEQPQTAQSAPADMASPLEEQAFETAVDSLLAELGVTAPANGSLQPPARPLVDGEEPVELVDASLEIAWSD